VLNIFDPHRGFDGRQRFAVRLRFEKLIAVRFAVRFDGH
jgi:hypothetical protein